MSDIEAELRSALRRKQPSTEFAERVVEAARRGHYEKRPRRRSMAGWMGVAASLALCAVAGGYWEIRREARRTVDQLNLAVQITGQKLSLVGQAAARGLSERDSAEKE